MLDPDDPYAFWGDLIVVWPSNRREMGHIYQELHRGPVAWDYDLRPDIQPWCGAPSYHRGSHVHMRAAIDIGGHDYEWGKTMCIPCFVIVMVRFPNLWSQK